MPRPRRTVDQETGEIKTDAVALAMEVFEDGFEAKPLAWKLARIRGMVGNIPKTGYNNFHKYSYTTETDLVSRIGPILAAAGILIVPSVEEHELIQYGGGDTGQKAGRLTVIKLKYTVSDGKESIEGSMIGYGDDAGDKGAYKAITGAMKYVLMKLFLVDTGDDPEADTTTDTRRSTAPRRSSPPPSAPPPPEPPASTAPIITDSTQPVERGGRTMGPSMAQLQRLGALMRDAGWTGNNLLPIIEKTFGDELVLPGDAAERGVVLKKYFNDLTGEEMGKLILAVEMVIGLQEDSVDYVEPEPEPIPYG